MQIDSVDIDLLIPDPDNANTHDEKNLKAIRGSIKKFGMVEPLVVRRQNNVVLGGNGRLAVLKELGHTHAPVHYVDLDDQKAKALAIALNRTSELSKFNTDILMKQLKELQAADFDIGEIGFDAEDIKFDVPPVEGLTDPDDVPENVETRCKPGDLWILGNHRLLCGDSTNVQHVERLMDGKKADMVFTDPPYGVNEETDRAFASRTRKAKGNTFSKIIGDDSIDTALAAFSICDSQADTVCYWGGNYYAHKMPASPCWIVWDKREQDIQRDMNSDCELAYVKHPSKKSVRIFRHLWKGMIKASEHGQARVHPTQKPIALAEWAFAELDPKGSAVLDLFLGSGSTLIACEKTGRKCYGMEIDPKYCDVIIKRWEQFTGKTATLESQHG